MWLRFAGRSVLMVVAVALMVAGLGFAGSSSAAAQSVADVEVRDRLIADQEALLNTYRCMFGVDTEVVPGGCSGGAPVLPAEGPSPFPGIPNAQDIAVRDQLIVDQEALLNVYRCQFNVDTQIVSGGCQDGNPVTTPITPEDLGPVPPNEEPWSEYLRIEAFEIACGYREGIYRQCHNHPEDTNEVARRLSDLFGCEWNLQRGGCHGYGGARMRQLADEVFCQNGWFFRSDNSVESRPGYCYHPEHPDVAYRHRR